MRQLGANDPPGGARGSKCGGNGAEGRRGGGRVGAEVLGDGGVRGGVGRMETELLREDSYRLHDLANPGHTDAPSYHGISDPASNIGSNCHGDPRKH